MTNGEADVFAFGKFAYQRRLAKALRQRPLDGDAIEELRIEVDARGQELPWGLLWKMHLQAKEAMDGLTEESPLRKSLYQIFRSSLGEVQNRTRAR